MTTSYRGLQPVEYNVIVELEDISERSGGGIFLPADKVERLRLEATEGTLVALSPLAFTYEEWPADARQPGEGDKVYFARFAGILVERDGKWIRILKDKDIVAVVEPSPALAAAA